jgi:hypothetical protein
MAARAHWFPDELAKTEGVEAGEAAAADAAPTPVEQPKP